LLSVSTAIFTDGLYTENLFSTELALGFFGPEKVWELARAFTVIVDCASQLREFYIGLESQILKLHSSVRHLFPSPVSADPKIKLPQLEYIGRMDRFGASNSLP
jgi:hypothetical protein